MGIFSSFPSNCKNMICEVDCYRTDLSFSLITPIGTLKFTLLTLLKIHKNIKNHPKIHENIKYHSSAKRIAEITTFVNTTLYIFKTYPLILSSKSPFSSSCTHLFFKTVPIFPIIRSHVRLWLSSALQNEEVP